MKLKIISLLVIILLFSVAVSGFSNPFVQFQIENLDQQLLFYSPYENFVSLVKEVVVKLNPESAINIEAEIIKPLDKSGLEPVEVVITQNGFEPQEVFVGVNQVLVWKNERPKLTALVLGVREISMVNSGVLESGMEFTQKFSEPGEYTYVDGIMIGRFGKVIVQ
mgnify:CR=1 FL=1